MAARKEIFVPGRICLMGEHSDWAGSQRKMNREIVPGMCLVSGTNQGLYARIGPHPTHLVVSSTDQLGRKEGPVELPMDPQKLLNIAREGGHFSYVAGVAYHISLNYRVGGLVIDNYKTDLPLRKGLSSSAAVCVLAARAFNRVYDLKLSVRGEMDIAYQGEITTPSQCGRMDQCCAFGQRPVLMTFDGDRVEVDELSLGGTLHLVIVELAGKKDTTEILHRLQSAYPRAYDDAQKEVQKLLGETNQRIVRATMEALAAGDMPRVGALMREAQEAFDAGAMPMCPSQLTAPNLHKVLALESLKPHIWGGKGVGSQGDGCAQLLCKSEDDLEKVMAIVQNELGMSCMPLSIGAPHAITQAIIPAASFSTNLFPMSKALPPALFPVVDSDGLLKPAILLLVEEAISAGVQRVVIVVSPDQFAAFEQIFHKRVSSRDYFRLPPNLQQYESTILDIGKKVVLAVQEEQLGLGHAVLCAKPSIVTTEPFLLMLGDHLYRSSHLEGTSCVKQLLDSFNGRSTIALRRTNEGEINHFGCATGRWEVKRDAPSYKRLTVSHMVEKPTREYARDNLATPGLSPGEYLTAFGLYIITEASLFDSLEKQDKIREQVGPTAGLLQLTPALDSIRAEAGLDGVLLDGERFDIGNDAQHYLSTLQSIARKSSDSGSRASPSLAKRAKTE